MSIPHGLLSTRYPIAHDRAGQLARRRDAALRLEPLSSGRRDPVAVLDRRPKQPDLTLDALRYGGTVTPAEAREAMQAFPEYAEFIEQAMTVTSPAWTTE